MKKKTNISDKALKLITQQQLKPIPKWEFLIKNCGLWLAFVICLIALILGISVSYFGLFDNLITSYFWIFIALLFLLSSYLLFEQTKKAYRLQKWQVIISLCFVGLIFGGILFKIGIANKIDKNLEMNLPYYRHLVPMKLQLWNNPSQGYLSGSIINLTTVDNFQLQDFNGKLWTIITNSPLIRGRVQMIVGQQIKLIGTQTGEYTFNVVEIRPWTGMGQDMMKEN